MDELYILISCIERDLKISFFPSYNEAYGKMKNDLVEVLGDRFTEDNKDVDYGLDDFNAWSNAHSINCDWLIRHLHWPLVLK